MSSFWNASKYIVRYGHLIPSRRIIGFLEWSQIRDLFRKYRINCVLDVGANRGQYTKNCAESDLKVTSALLNRSQRNSSS